MRRWIAVGFAITLAIGIMGLSSNEAAEPEASEWKPTWSDEFKGNAIDPINWDFDIGNGFYEYGANQWISGWGNNELQYYTRDEGNAFVRGGMLHIRVLKESLHNCGYTSARMKTRNKLGAALFAQRYGKFEIRARLPTGQGIWPAIWMLPAQEKYGGWASSGEIDIMEARGQRPNEVLGTLHFGSRWPANTEVSSTHLFPKGESISDFHTYALEWEPSEIRWLVDGKLFARKSFWWSSSKVEGGKGQMPKKEGDLNPWPAPFDQPFYLILNVAVGGKFPGNPDATTKFPAEMVIDYVRAYEKVGGYGKPQPRGEGKLPFAP